ncbi:hypothetical protein IC232_05495 [Microvirga sp. BT688]|uniref:hypothetical protein n=1 Tax=Microvirga sp. TaxID=1873136 RepID=UPI001683BA9F|nr:hypothetical protein [Microvirga sp.]MBD2746152.1 hypothetical protein [Microvirga sp.]
MLTSPAIGPLTSWAPGRLPSRFYHATPLYRYDPMATDNHGLWDPAVHGQIKGHGLKPCTLSSKDVAAVFLTDEIGIALNYAECNRGEEWPVDWVILEIDGTAFDEAHLLPDLDQEAQTMADDILAHGFTQAQWDAGAIPWFAVLNVTGQVRYTAPIPDAAIRSVRILPVSPKSR